jgi:hypothetical protein
MTAMDEATKTALRLDDFTAWFHSWGIRSFDCLQCKAVFHKARRLKAGLGGTYLSAAFCRQECHDAWFARFHIPSNPVEKVRVNPDGTTDLIGYVALSGPRHGFVPLEDVA